eukprot:2217365-Karenia_brevis.AAC.1
MQEGEVWSGRRSRILGKACLGLAVAAKTERECEATRPRHLATSLPHKIPWGLPFQGVVRFTEGAAYVHRRGAKGMLKFRPP